MSAEMFSEFVSLGDLCRSRLGMQAQYGCRYAHGVHGSENCGEGLRFVGDIRDYHAMKIHRDDVETFVQRVTAVRPRIF